MSAAHVLHHSVGVPVRKIPSILRTLTGVRITQSAITQDALRRAKGEVGDAYRSLRGSVRSSSFVHTDDTGWRVGGEPAFLMAFETDEASCVPDTFSPPKRGGQRVDPLRLRRSDGYGQGQKL